MAKPKIPKRLAARIRGAQDKVYNARSRIASAEFNIVQREARLAEFNADPEAFSDRYYPDLGVESYPVTTTISRDRERQEVSISRRQLRIKALAEVDKQLATIEADILLQIATMRPTSGRVPWPKSLVSFDRFMQREMAAAYKERDTAGQRFDAEHAQLNKEFEAAERTQAAMLAREDQKVLAELDRLSPKDREAIRQEVRIFRKAMKDNNLTIIDVLAYLNNRK